MMNNDYNYNDYNDDDNGFEIENEYELKYSDNISVDKKSNTLHMSLTYILLKPGFAFMATYLI